LPVVDALIAKEKYLDAAEVMFASVQPADFSGLIRELFVIPRYAPSNIHRAVLDIDPKVVVTTNYDDIYDTYCRSGEAEEGYNTCRYYDTHLVADLRSPVRLIVKAHGCVSDTAHMVLTRSQYFEQKQRHPSFFRVLDALFLTNTLLFVGYSLSDPDIQLLLENASIAAASVHPHYAVMPNNTPDALRASAKKAYNIEFLEYEAGNFVELDEGLKDLAAQVNAAREENPTI
jgi:hypothetical protein